MKTEKELRAYLNKRGINLENYLEETPNADEYFEEKAQMINKIDGEMMENLDSETLESMDEREYVEILSEAEAYRFLSQRGFGDLPITTNYSMEGQYFDSVEISDSASTRHPAYETKYESDSGEIWTLSLIGKDITAYPLLFNLEASLEAEMIVAESEMVTSYNSETNMFYKSIPKDSALIVKLVNKVDKDTLDRMTAEVMRQ